MLSNRRRDSSQSPHGSLFPVTVFLLALVILLAGLGEASATMESTTRDGEKQKPRGIRKSFHGQRRLESDDFKTSKMMEKFQIARAKFTEKLVKEYGAENVPLLFQTERDGKKIAVSRGLFRDSGVSWQRTKEKMIRKILTAQIEATSQRFVWATGGHSAAAGHGNLFNQSYTMVMAEGSKDIFNAVGLDFLPRPYAMGGASQGYELAWCQKEVYGWDVDILSSDFSMTTVRRADKSAMWHYRSALLPSRPTLIEFYPSVKHVSDDMETRGYADISPAYEYFDYANKLPDTAGKTQEEIDAMPSHVRSFRCDKATERGDPTCDKSKYSSSPDGKDPCDNRKYRVSWHPGWKWHAIMGNIMSSFLVEIISDALEAISVDGSDPKALLDSLKAKEDEALKDWNAQLPRSISTHIDQITDIPTDVIYKKQNICHTARLPAETRYNGILTETDTKGGFESYYKGGEFAYDKGLEAPESRHQNNTDKLVLTFDSGTRQSFCKNDILQIDFQDFFAVNSDITSKLVLPNPTEKLIYKLNESFHGFIAMCQASCGWRCPGDTVTREGYLGGNVTMNVNGVAVVDYTNIEDGNCFFLKHAGGHKFEPNGEGLFEITAKMNVEHLYTRISSFILW